MIIVGDELDALKFSPLVRAVEDADAGFQVDTCVVTQNADSVLHTLQTFGLQPDVQLETIPIGKNLCTTVGVVVENVTRLIEQRKPDAVLVCGSSAIAMGAGLAANHMDIPLGHIEAGIRSGRVDAPFPDELLRRQLADLACWHFASSEHAVENLLAEGIGKESIYQVGSCSIDALRILKDGASKRRDTGDVLIVLSHSERIASVAEAIKKLSNLYPDRQFNVFIDRRLRNSEVPGVLSESSGNINVYDDGSPPEVVRSLLKSDLVFTDCGYMVEMSAALGIPNIIVQEQLDRPEAVDYASALFASDESREIVESAEKTMGDADQGSTMVNQCSVYGEGYAAQKIAAALKIELQLLKHTDTLKAREISRVFVPMFASLN